ncbi:MAG: L,D-transpeptidase [Verrucomicrobium sp.]|nr:L,D-transpeptidase [Verrucomicrobium sp.]
MNKWSQRMKSQQMIHLLARTSVVLGTGLMLSQCASTKSKVAQNTNVVVSVKEQKLALYNKDGKRLKEYPVSTSKFGLSDKPGTNGTPLGMHEIVAKIGQGVPPGSVFKSRKLTGEVIKPDSPGRDPIVTRIMWLRGMESQNKNAYGRCIYIHGTAEERNVGKPVSYGCVRMTSRDVMDVFDRTGIGSNVMIVEGKLPGHVPAAAPAPMIVPPVDAPPIFLNPNTSPQGPLGQPEKSESLLAANSAKPAAAPAPAPAPEVAHASATPKRSLFGLNLFRHNDEPISEELAIPASAPVSRSERTTSASQPMVASSAPEPVRASAPASATAPTSSLDPESEVASTSTSGSFQAKQLKNGATVIYSASPAGPPTTPMVLKSKKTASKGLKGGLASSNS